MRSCHGEGKASSVELRRTQVSRATLRKAGDSGLASLRARWQSCRRTRQLKLNHRAMSCRSATANIAKLFSTVTSRRPGQLIAWGGRKQLDLRGTAQLTAGAINHNGQEYTTSEYIRAHRTVLHFVGVTTVVVSRPAPVAPLLSLQSG